MKPLTTCAPGVIALALALSANAPSAQTACPAELAAAKSSLQARRAAAPRRVPSPRAPSVPAPDAQGMASPDIVALTLDKAERLVIDAEQDCARNDMTSASSVAKLALELMKTLD